MGVLEHPWVGSSWVPRMSRGMQDHSALSRAHLTASAAHPRFGAASCFKWTQSLQRPHLWGTRTHTALPCLQQLSGLNGHKSSHNSSWGLCVGLRFNRCFAESWMGKGERREQLPV